MQIINSDSDIKIQTKHGTLLVSSVATEHLL